MKKKIIWVIDDDIIYQTIINKLIQKSGVFSTHSSFMNGKDAITALKNVLEQDESCVPDIILLDINMPVMDGWMGIYGGNQKNKVQNQETVAHLHCKLLDCHG